MAIESRFNNSRNHIIYYVRLMDEKGDRRLFSPGHTSKKMAREYEQKLKNEIAEKKMFPERSFTKIRFKDFIPDYLQKHASKMRSYRDYVSICKKLVAFFGEYYLHEITRYQIATYYSNRSNEVKISHNREINILKGIFSRAIEWGFLRDNPAKGFKVAKEKARTRFLRPCEAYILIEACNDARAKYLKSMIILDLNTGLRKDELLSLRWNDISPDLGMLTVVDGKGGKSRKVPINETAREQLLLRMKKRKGDYVFHDCYGRRIKDIKKSFAGAVERSGLDDVRFHDLRRTFGTCCALKNVPPKTLQGWMGHSSIETTMKYYVVSTEDFEREAIKRLDAKAVATYTATKEKEGAAHDAQPLVKYGEPCRNRTCDPLIKRHPVTSEKLQKNYLTIRYCLTLSYL